MEDQGKKENISTEKNQAVDPVQNQATTNQTSKKDEGEKTFTFSTAQLEAMKNEIVKNTISGFQQQQLELQKKKELEAIQNEKNSIIENITKNEAHAKSIENVMPNWKDQSKDVILALQKTLGLSEKKEQNTSSPVGFSAPLQSDGEVKSYNEAVDVAAKKLQEIRGIKK